METPLKYSSYLQLLKFAHLHHLNIPEKPMKSLVLIKILRKKRELENNPNTYRVIETLSFVHLHFINILEEPMLLFVLMNYYIKKYSKTFNLKIFKECMQSKTDLHTIL